MKTFLITNRRVIHNNGQARIGIYLVDRTDVASQGVPGLNGAAFRP